MLEKMDRSFLRFAVSLYIPGFFVSLGFSIASPILPIYAQSFGVPIALVAMVSTTNALGRILSDIPLGALCDRVGRRPLTIFGPLLITLSAILSGLAQSFYELLIYRFMTGVGMSMWMVARQAMIADTIDPSIRGRVMSTFQGVNMIGSASGPAVGGIVAELWGDRMPFFFYGASTFISLVTGLLFIRESAPASQRENRSHLGADVRKLLGFLTFSVIIAAFANFANHLRFSGRAVLLPLYGDNILHLTRGEVGLVLSASTIANVLMVIPGGYIVDKYGRKAGLVPSFILTGLVFGLFPLSTDFASAVIISTFLGVAGGIGGGASMALAADLAPEGLRGAFLGFWSTVGDAGSAIGPVVLGLVADLYGLASSFHVICALMLFTAGTTQLFVKETLKTKSEKST